MDELASQRRSFHDPEYDCYFVPTDSDGHGLEIGRANEGDSYFNMTLIQGPDTDPGKVSFGVGFGPDSTVKARFESAVIRVEFGYDGDVEGRSFPLRIKDIHPKDDEGQSTEVVFGKESNISLGLSVGPGSAASLSSSGGYSQNKQYTRKTAARVRGQGGTQLQCRVDICGRRWRGRTARTGSSVRAVCYTANYAADNMDQILG